MKKRFKLIIFTIILINIIFISINTIKIDAASTPINGDLKCPERMAGCREYPVGNPSRVEIETSSSDNKVSVKKIVEKNGAPGNFLITFQVKTTVDATKNMGKKSCVVVLLDYSGSLTGNEKNLEAAKTAIKDFSTNFAVNGVVDSNNKLSLISFGRFIEVSYDMQSSTFKSIKTRELDNAKGKSSHLEKAYSGAIDQLNKCENDANKYVVLFGDGRYWSPEFTGLGDGKEGLNAKFNTLNSMATIIGIHYKGTTSPATETQYKKYYKSAGCKKGYSSENALNCDVLTMKKYVNQYFEAANGSYKDAFNSVFKEINPETGINSAVIEDIVGGEFSIEGISSIRNTVTIDVPEITKDYKPVKSFKISIDPNATGGWNHHYTNNGFRFSYKYSLKDNPLDGLSGIIKNSIQPEVYWEKETTPEDDIPDEETNKSGTCILNETNEKIKKDRETYYTKSCEERNFHIEMKIADGKDEGFSIPKGGGFPAIAHITTDFKCSYEFDIKKFTDNYNYYSGMLSEYKGELESIIEQKPQKESDGREKQAEINSIINEIRNNYRIKATYVRTLSYDENLKRKLDEYCDIISYDTSTIPNYEEFDLTDEEKIQLTKKIVEYNNKKIALETIEEDIRRLDAQNTQLQGQIRAAEGELRKLNNAIKEYNTTIVPSSDTMNEWGVKNPEYSFITDGGTMKVDGQVVSLANRQLRVENPTDGLKYGAKYEKDKTYTEHVSGKTVKFIYIEKNVKVKYPNSDSNDWCTGKKPVEFKAGGKIFSVTSATCSVSYEKELAPDTPDRQCVNIRTGNADKCNDTNKQLDGDYQYFQQKKGNDYPDNGSASIELKELGYKKLWNYSLNNCPYTTLDFNLYFRNIDVADPFLKTKNPSRVVGKNWKNSTLKYDFTKIINPNIWKLTPYHEPYQLSKVDISSIVSSNANDPENYLGTDCHIDGNGTTYKCDLVK